MTFALGLVLLGIGLALIVVARQRADGSSMLRIEGGMLMVYPALCLAFVAYGIAFMVTGS